jgi:predicted peptidase
MVMGNTRMKRVYLGILVSLVSVSGTTNAMAMGKKKPPTMPEKNSYGIQGLESGSLITSTSAASTTYRLSNGSSSINLTAQLGEGGRVHYAVFNNNPGALSASQVKYYAAKSIGGNLVARGIMSRSSAGSLSASASGLPDKALYTVYAVSETTAGVLSTSVKSYASVLPRKVSMQQYNSSTTNKSGRTGDIVRYYVYYPAGYYDNPTQTFPMLLYHGGGGENFSSSTNAESYFLTGHRRMNKTPLVARINLGQEMPFVVITPQCNNALWTCTSATKYLAEVIDKSISRYRINAKRVYATGMSDGGRLVWNTAYDYPQKITAIAPAAATVDRSRTASNLCARFGTYKVRVWHHHNVSDAIYSASTAQEAVNVIKKCSGGVDARITIYDGKSFPVTRDKYRHATIEYVLNAPWVDYSIDPAVLYSSLVPLAPEFVGDLDRAESDLRNLLNNPSLNLTSLYSWFLLWSK